MGKNVVLSGNLHFLGIPELLQLLATNSSTGVLGLTNSHAWGPASVTFLEGNPIHAVYGSANGLEALYALFGWATGHFEFSREKATGERTIRANHMEIVLDGLRMLDEGLTKRLGPGWEEKGRPGQMDNPLKLPLIKKSISHYAYMATEEEFPKGATIIKEGEFGNWIWMVLRGTADMSKKTIAGPTKILRVGEGAFIGNISSMMTTGHRRITTFTANETIRLGVLDPATIYAGYSSLSSEFRSVLISLDNRFREITERLSEIYSGINAREEAFFTPKIQTGKGKRIEDPFLILKGNAKIIKEMQDQNFPLINLHEDDFFGPLPFLEMGHEPISASVLFSADLKSIALDPDNLQGEYDRLSNILKNIIDFSLNCITIATMRVQQLYMQGQPRRDHS